MKNLLLVFVLLALNLTALGQEKVIFTDRPTVTDAVPLISPGTFQVEAGYVVTNAQTTISDDVTTHTFPNLSMKFGLLNWLELRVLTNYAVNQNNDPAVYFETQRGITPITFSPKFGLLEQNGAIPRTSLATSFTFPNIGAEVYQLNELNYGFRLLFEYGFDQFTWINSTGTDWPKGSEQIWAFTTVGGYSITDKLGAFLEFFGTFNDDGNGLRTNFGLTYLVAENFQVDLIYGTQLDGTNYQLFGFGCAWNTNFRSD